MTASPGPYAEDHARLRIYRRLPGHRAVPHAWPKVVQTTREPATRLSLAIDSTRRDAAAALDPAATAEAILLGLDVGVVVVDPHYDIVRINTAARRMLGVHGTAFEQDFIHLADALPSTAVRSAIDAALAGRPAAGSTRSSRSTSRPTRHASSRRTSVPIAGSRGTIDGAVIELTDVTDIERERRGQPARRQRLDKAAALNERLLRANDELTALIAELRLSNSAMLRSSEDAQAGREEVETLNEEFQATNEELETLNEELTATVEELRIANEDLAARTEDLRLQAVAIEQQKQATEEEHDRLGSILASIGDAVVAVDHDGKTILTNVIYDRLFGGPDAEIRLEDVAGLPFLPEDWPQRRAARGERFRIEFAVSDADGERHWFEAVAEPLTGQDRTWGGVVSIRDVSERTMRLSLERLMAAAGHELKTPTAAIHNYLQLVERRLARATSTRPTYAARAMIQAQRLASSSSGCSTSAASRAGGSRSSPGGWTWSRSSARRPRSRRSCQRPDDQFARRPPHSRSRETPAGSNRSSSTSWPTRSSTRRDRVDRGVGQAIGAFAEVDVRDHGRGIAAEDLPVLFEAYTRLGEPQMSPVSGWGCSWPARSSPRTAVRSR